MTRRLRFGAALRPGALRLLWAAPLLFSCTADPKPLGDLSSFRVEVTAVNANPPPASDAPLAPNRGDVEEVWDFTIEARGPDGKLEDFDGVVRVRVEPGAVLAVIPGDGSESLGRNIRLNGGKASGQVTITAVYGDSRLWIEDLGYLPAPAGEESACANGKNDDGDEDALVDFPHDPGCAFADDDTETGGTFAAGVSQAVHYALPRIVDIQGEASVTPYPFEGMEVNTQSPQNLVVTRVASQGFFVTDLGDQGQGYNHLFAFNFSTPAGMRVCDRVSFLAGTVSEFFGYTELTFPSYRVDPISREDLDAGLCPVPPPVLLNPTMIADPEAMERIEAALVRVDGYRIAGKFGPKPAFDNVFGEDQSNCDLNGDGVVDFENEQEGACGNACSADPDCSEWVGFAARGNFKVSDGASVIQVNTGGSTLFDPTEYRGLVLSSVTGTLANFSGGSLNWTVETRCPDDLVCGTPENPIEGCVLEPVPSNLACIRDQTIDDNDEASN